MPRLPQIIVADDASPINEHTAANSKINELKNCRFERHENNLGRSQNRNLLISKAQYEWVLLMDFGLSSVLKTKIPELQHTGNTDLINAYVKSTYKICSSIFNIIIF